MSSLAGEKPCSEGVKRRARRKAAKAAKRSSLTLENDDQNTASTHVLDQMKLELEKAKADGDSKRAHAVRERMWALQDAAAGVKSDISRQELKNILNTELNKESAENGPKTVTGQNGDATEDDAVTKENRERANQASVRVQVEFLEKKMRKLQKKKAQIEKLKERLVNGEDLEKTQISKIDSEKELDDQIDDVEEELYRATRL